MKLRYLIMGSVSFLPAMSWAGFIDEGKASLTMQNFYFNNDWRQDGAVKSKSEEWAQSFLLKYQSGFTEGPVGFGIDALGLVGIKLDSSPDRTGTGLLPVGAHGAPDEYSKFGPTAKARYSNSLLRAGSFIPTMPVAQANQTRMLPQVFRGYQLTFGEIEDLTVDVGRFTQNSFRNESGSDDIVMAGRSVRGGQATDKFDFASVNYNWAKNIQMSYNYADLDLNYKQHIVTFKSVVPLGEGNLTSDVRYATSSGEANSNVDNKTFGSMFTYRWQAHSFGLAYQNSQGKSGYPYLGGGDPYLVNTIMISDFGHPGEKSWQFRYDYDFAALGVPGLTFMTRYIVGDEYKDPAGLKAQDWERNMDIGYVIQSGPLKNLGVRWRNATYRSSGGDHLDQNRFILLYTLALF